MTQAKIEPAPTAKRGLAITDQWVETRVTNIQ
jgi:hypothetical protein